MPGRPGRGAALHLDPRLPQPALFIASHGVQTLIICGVTTGPWAAPHCRVGATVSYTDALHEGGLAAVSDVAEIATSIEIADRLVARAAR